jgi:hypothetical protein
MLKPYSIFRLHKLSVLCFFKKGKERLFELGGKEASGERDWFIMKIIVGRREAQSWRWAVGMGSMSHCSCTDEVWYYGSLVTSDTVAYANEESIVERGGG